MSAGAWIAVALLGGAAALARFLLDAAISERSRAPFPAGTLAVNLSGAVALGLLAGAALHGAALHGAALTVVAGGGLGSYTTFSTWMFESQRLGEAGDARSLWLNLGLSLLAGLGALALGRWLGGVL
ncbi:MAG TPA: fluoride efflux transporter CrcB [Solirubrobacterales bacterium]|nr:fluoride efflux transporter CrcB [Solirubrobacterales bacterium]